ncbi:MAG: DNA repair protein RecN [Castellaniella sp.]|uniref:DNA repair protein RecN n=1 Tax=Castellaniella sp. TaxID=1955812 RepID=UPI00120C869F|nr:DNA repair protein RecN [Castellaniella sp.]TAN29772.1 MAG: DNA repair protein RecN [Castellaniella sp.]
MLRALHIRDFVIVDQAELSFEAGFTVFSGETGAGKSILIDALSLALGGRGDPTLVREGASRTDISAVFEAPPAAADWLAEQSLDGPEIILRRVIDTQGRSKAYINGQPATLTQLRDLGTLLVDIHGQHAHQSLLEPTQQRALLDTQGGHAEQARAVEQAWTAWRNAQAALQNAQSRAADQTALTERLTQDVAFLDELAPQPEEWPELCTRQSRLAHAQALLAGAHQAIEALDGESGSAAQALRAAHQALQALVRHDPGLAEHCQSMESAQILCSETVSGLNAYVDRLELDPDALAQAEARMSRLFEAARRFHIEPEELPQHHETLRTQLQQIEAGHDLQALTQACERAEGDYQARAKALSTARQTTAERLSAQVTEAMQTLSMEGGTFRIETAPCKPSAHGLESVEFLVSGHAGVTPRPLSRIASGGELARISLALSVIASQAARVPTLIFDEVDAGIGGAVAEVIGRLLHQLGQRHQVLCVTHLPQVAACASHHFQVSKTTHQGHTASAIRNLSDDRRVDEIARMLGGLKMTTATRDHAREMLKLSAV